MGEAGVAGLGHEEFLVGRNVPTGVQHILDEAVVLVLGLVLILPNLVGGTKEGLAGLDHQRGVLGVSLRLPLLLLLFLLVLQQLL